MKCLLKYAIINIFFVSFTFNVEAEQVVTNPKRVDGFGAQFLHVIDAALYADVHGLKFVYTPFSTMEHNYDSDPNFLAKKESLINFINNFDINADFSAPVAHDIIDFFNKNVDKCVECEMYKKIKRIFRENKDIRTYFNPDRFNIAVHVRRHNSHDNRIEGTDTPDDFYVNMIKKLRELYKYKNPLFHIYSQGKPEMFTQYIAQDIVLHVNDTIEHTFASMVLADVLVASRSDFSYAAGVLSNGVVYYTPYYGHVTLPHWKLASELQQIY